MSLALERCHERLQGLGRLLAPPGRQCCTCVLTPSCLLTQWFGCHQRVTMGESADGECMLADCTAICTCTSGKTVTICSFQKVAPLGRVLCELLSVHQNFLNWNMPYNLLPRTRNGCCFIWAHKGPFAAPQGLLKQLMPDVELRVCILVCAGASSPLAGAQKYCCL